MRSIMQKEQRCYICGYTKTLEVHHCLHGTANRKNSERYGLKVFLCHQCHDKVHFGQSRILDEYLCREAQKAFEEKYSHEKFMEVFHRNWL